jgi:hypothetical protein
MQTLVRVAGVLGVAAVGAMGGSLATLQLMGDRDASAPTASTGAGASQAPAEIVASIDPRIVPPPGMSQPAPPPIPLPPAVPTTEGPIVPEPEAQNAPPLVGGYAPPSPPRIDYGAHGPGAGPSAMPPLAAPPRSQPAPALPGLTPPDLPGTDPHDPSTWPAHLRPPAAAGEPPSGGSAPPSDSKVLSYFQRTKTQVDTKKAFGFVLLPRAALTDVEKRTQQGFCELVLASMDFLSPGAASEAVAQFDILVTYWPIDPARNSFEVSAAFAARDCNDLIAWYDHNFARRLATKAGVAHLGGPLLITWPSSGVNEQDRNPLVVDFSKANHERAVKALRYWFRQLRHKPSLWTSRIREGTIRAELADAVNDTAGVIIAVLYGKWDSFAAVGATATP